MKRSSENENEKNGNKEKKSRAEYMREYRARMKNERAPNVSKPPPLSTNERQRKFVTSKRNNLILATASAGQERVDTIIDKSVISIDDQPVIHQQVSPQSSTYRGLVKSKPLPLSSTERSIKSRNNKRKKNSSIHESIAIDQRQGSPNSNSTYYTHGLITNDSVDNDQNNCPRTSYVAPIINCSANSSTIIHEYNEPSNIIVTTALIHSAPRSQRSDVPVSSNINNKRLRLGNALTSSSRLARVLSPELVVVESRMGNDTICTNNTFNNDVIISEDSHSNFDNNSTQVSSDNDQAVQNNLTHVTFDDLPTRNNSNQICLPYDNYHRHEKAFSYYEKHFVDNTFGHTCDVCERLWFYNDLKKATNDMKDILHVILPEIDNDNIKVCNTCRPNLNNGQIPIMATYNGFKFPEKPIDLPLLDLVSERLISPRLPFMQIRRLRHVNGQYGILGQVINVPVDVDNMITSLPRQLSDDYCINVHIAKKMIHKSSYLQGFINKRTIKTWLKYLTKSPLYTMYNIEIDESFFDDEEILLTPRDEVSEHIPVDESLIAQQQSLLWCEDKYLRIAPGENNVPQSLLFDEHAEELSFPAIYLGQFRRFNNGINVTPFMMTSSELRRKDRRAVTPQHLLYCAMKILRIKVRDSLSVAFKNVGRNTNITRQQIESEEYVNNCLESNLAFLRSVPNSVWYWSERKRDLFAMIRQLGKPTVFLTVSANEIGSFELMKVLYKFKNNGRDLTAEQLSQMHYIQKTTLVNEDAVTCAIHFNKFINILLTILQSRVRSPFGQYYVIHYFKRIEFQHRGSPHAHMLLWLNNAPEDVMGADKNAAIALIDELISVSAKQASGHIKLQTHKHTFTCYKKMNAHNPRCRFEAPFMPMKSTSILTPMTKETPGFNKYAAHYKSIRVNLENNNYTDFQTFYAENNINSDGEYEAILKSGINRPRVFVKREPSEKWHNPFSPFILNIAKSNTDLQLITEEYSCAQYVAEYVNKTSRGISDLQKRIIKCMDENPEFQFLDIAKKLGVDMLNTVEMTSQEAAWYLLREPMSRSSSIVVSIPTVWPSERQRIKKTKKELDSLQVGDDSTNIWKENWFVKYEQRSDDLANITLAQFVAFYSLNKKGIYMKRKRPRIIRWRRYNMNEDLNEYKREMVTLHVPFSDEETEILADMKFVEVYDRNEELILNRRKEFESSLDIDKTIEICKSLCREDNTPEELPPAMNRPVEIDPFLLLANNPNSAMNYDVAKATLAKLGAVAKHRENLMENEDFWRLMRMTNEKQRALLMHAIYHLQSNDLTPFQIFFTGPAGCGKTFVIKLLMEIYNRFTTNDNFCNAYITCASTGKAAVAIGGTTVHTALKISLSKLLPVSIEMAGLYRSLFQFVKVIIIDEISMIGAELLEQIDARIKQITGHYNVPFGGLDMILIGDLRQLPPVRATPIYKQKKQQMVGPILWRGLKFYELDQVMRQANRQFSSILTKLGNGDILDPLELQLLESRFHTAEDAAIRCRQGIRLFNTNFSVNAYNHKILSEASDELKITIMANDVFIGCETRADERKATDKLHGMSLIDTSGLPRETTFVKEIYYMVTTNIDVSDGLANGAVGKLVHVEKEPGDKPDSEKEVTSLWLEFADRGKVGEKVRRKTAPLVAERNISKNAVPIFKRSATISLNNNKTWHVKRTQFPLVCACATTIHKSQGSTYGEIVYEYDKSHSQQLLYVALSRVSSIEGLYIVPKNNTDMTFYHGRKESVTTKSLKNELARLSTNRLQTIDHILSKFLDRSTNKLTVYTFNCQSLARHRHDFTDNILLKSNILILTETWLKNEINVSLPNFNCVVQFKPAECRAGGVSIYHNNKDAIHIVTPSIDFTTHNAQYFQGTISNIGDVCMAECEHGGKKILIAAVYIRCNHSAAQIVKFLHKLLLPYTPAGSAALEENFDTYPMILAGDFNINFASEDAIPLIKFLKEKLNLQMSNNPTQSTTTHGTTIDAVFTRYLDEVRTLPYISYFSYHKPLVSCVTHEQCAGECK